VAKPKALYIGLMSGTSVDGIDGVLANFSSNNPQILATYKLALPTPIKEKVFDLAISGSDELKKIQYLDQYFGEKFAEVALSLCEEVNLKPSAITAIGSHGQTVRHCPPTDLRPGYSLQLGDPNIIAQRTGITTITDFRRRDIAAGGHGAPLAPALHSALFQSSECSRFILNTGGIANITYLPIHGGAIGFDTGPANGLMDAWCQYNKNIAFDKNGRWAMSGKIIPDLLVALLAHPYFQSPPPKSTGREDFNLSWLKQKLAGFSEGKAEDIQATLLELTAASISAEIIRLDADSDAEVFICGGGAHNTALCERLKELLAPRSFKTTVELGISPDWVEAVAFAWLAKQSLEGKTGNLPSVTGAEKRVILGGIYPA
jgi:anhydro-N-acetylmuramic acid kinase